MMASLAIVAATQMHTYRKLASLVIPIFLFASFNKCVASNAVDGIANYRAKKVTASSKINNSAYDRLMIKHSKWDFDYYDIEKQPTYVTPSATIQSVRIGKMERKFPTPAPNSRADNQTNSKAKGAETSPRDFVYLLYFTVSPAEGKRLSAFANSNLGALFQVKIGVGSLGLVQFHWEFEVKDDAPFEFAITTKENSAVSVRQILAPLRTKVVWE